MSMKIAVPGFLILLSGCATMPTGPSVLVLPGTGKPFEQFQEDNAECQYWAAQQTGADPQPAAQRQAAADAARTVGITGTPAFFINGILISGARPLDDFSKWIDRELEAKGQTPPAS